MKNLLISALMLFLFMSTTVNATEENTVSRAEICESYARYAELVMELRQIGAPLSNILAPLGSDSSTEKEVMREIVLLAYEEPRYTTEAVQKREIQDFRNRIHVNCLRGN